MINVSKIKHWLYILLCMVLIAVIVSGCKTRGYDNFTTYFNTFYNENKLMEECEMEFDYQAEKKRNKPKVIVPMPLIPELQKTNGSAPDFLTGLKVNKATRQSVEVKLDSILIKGSKILAKSPKSDYVAPSLYLMAKSYFYKEEWLPSQVKCSELIDKEPTGALSPDAHLLMCLNLLMQGKYDAGTTMLSRTIDVAWLRNRYDILTEAFNIEAEMALYNNDFEGAIRPYFQAIAQSDDNKQKALWQEAMALILYRMHKFDRAEKAFAKVMQYNPDLVTEYESKLYRAACLIRLDKNLEADRILSRLDDDGKFTEWKDYVITIRLLQTYLLGNKEDIIKMEQYADSLFPVSQPKTAYYFEKGLNEFKVGNYIDSRSDISKSRNSVPIISQPATKLFAFMSQREIANKSVNDGFNQVRSLQAEMNKAKEEFAKFPLNVDTMVNGNTMNMNPVDSIDTANVVDTLKIDEDTTSQIAILDTLKVDEINDKTNKDTNITEIKNIQAQKLTANTLDSLQKEIDKSNIMSAHNYFELARLYSNIGNKDSANYFYKKSADIAPLTEENSSRYLYVYAESIRSNNEWQADSILNIIVSTQPKSEYGKVALAKLGYTEAFVTDTVERMYNSGYDLMKYNEYSLAIQTLENVYTQYSDNLKYAPKALYTLGYMYENKLSNFDSARYYYNTLLTAYPESEYAKDLLLSVKYKDLVDSGEEIPDSLKTKEIVLYVADTSIIHAPYDTTLLSKPGSLDGFSFDDLKDPSKLLKKTKDKIQQGLNKQIEDGKEMLNKGREALDKGKEVINNPDKALQDAKEMLKGKENESNGESSEQTEGTEIPPPGP